MAATAGRSSTIIEVEGKSGIGNVFGRRDPLTYEEVELAGAGAAGEGTVTGRTLTPDDALLEYLRDHGMKRISKRLMQSGALDVVSTAVPGLKDILVLGKVKQLERAGDDLLVLDAPAAGHAVTFLTSAAGLLDAARVGPIRAQAQDVVDLLSDPERCEVVLVTLPEETPVNEVVETAYKLEDRVGIKLGPIVVNGVYPVLDGLGDEPPADADLSAGQRAALKQAAEFRRSRQELQAEQLRRLDAALPLPQLRLPFLFTPEVGPAELDVLAAELARQVEALPG
jgi:anion-transporting  ArsA/GET3 family ATPase